MSILAALQSTVLIGATVFGVGQSQAESVVVRNLEHPGAVTIENHGGSVKLSRKVVIERKRGAEWIESPASFEIVEHCGVPTPPASCVDLNSNATVEPVPWTGYTCSGQCPRSCRSNHYAGPGIFRFVVLSCDHNERFTGPEFSLPPEKPR
jgi:hypothetical protein